MWSNTWYGWGQVKHRRGWEVVSGNSIRFSLKRHKSTRKQTSIQHSCNRTQQHTNNNSVRLQKSPPQSHLIGWHVPVDRKFKKQNVQIKTLIVFILLSGLNIICKRPWCQTQHRNWNSRQQMETASLKYVALGQIARLWHNPENTCLYNDNAKLNKLN